MKKLIAALLFSPAFAWASCYTHPETLVAYCTSAAECPGGTVWQAATHACSTPATSSTPSGSYVPGLVYASPNLAYAVVRPAIVSQSGNVITVTGAVAVQSWDIVPGAIGQLMLTPPSAASGLLYGSVATPLGEAGTIGATSGYANLTWPTPMPAAYTLTYTYTYLAP